MLVQYAVISYLAYIVGHFTGTAPVCRAFYFSVLQLILGFSQNLLESSGSNSVFTRHSQRRRRKWFPSARIHVSHVTRCFLHVKFCWWYWRHYTVSACLPFFGESTLHTSVLSRAESKNRTGLGTDCFAVWAVPTAFLKKAQVLYEVSGGPQSQPSTVQLSPYYLTWSLWVCCEAISVKSDTVLISSTTKRANTPDMGSIGQYTSKFRVLESNSVSLSHAHN